MSSKTIVIPAIAGMLAAIVGMSSPDAVAMNDQELAEKRALTMKDVRSAMGSLRRMVKGQKEFDREAAIEAVKVLQTELDDMPAVFAGGPTTAPSDSKPEIWSDWNGFMAILGDSKDAAGGLMSGVKTASNATELKDIYENLDRACEDCHDKFRK